MYKKKSITVKVPATTANIGAGFDCLGAALTLYNEFTFTESEKPTSINIIGDDSAKVNIDQNNLLYKSFLHYYEHIKEPPPRVEIDIKIGVPLARGLGSSATAIVGGLLGANYFSSLGVSFNTIIDLAIAMEGHPDNVVPALKGNCVLSVTNGNSWEFASINWHDNIVPIVAIPDFELSTEKARSVLPKQLSYSDAVFNMSHLGLLIKGLESGNVQWLRCALNDRLHQPYRKSLIKGFETVEEAIKPVGGYGLVISGAGPTLLTLSDFARAERVAEVMKQAWLSEGINAQVCCLNLDLKGATVNVH